MDTKERYVICEDSDTGALQRKVRELIDKGWVPTGGISPAYHKNTGRNIFYQAMVADTHGSWDPDTGFSMSKE